MKFPHLESAECTDTGRKRKHNEDSLIRIPEAGVFCVADGMGGTYGGEIASQATVAGLKKVFESAAGSMTFEQRIDVVRRSLNDSSRWIRNNADEMGVTGTGTTAIVIIFDPARPDRAAILHAGDSRVYRVRSGKLEQLSMDHSVAAAAGVKSDKSLPAMFRGVVTRAVGLEREVLLEETPVDVEAGDLYMLCSDGLNKMVPDKTVSRLIREDGGTNLTSLARLLVDTANAAGGEDNTSVVLIRVAASLPAPGAHHEEAITSDDTLATENVTPATSQALTLPTMQPPAPAPAERKSDEHFSGVTPVGETDTPTPVTSEFQQQSPTAAKTPVTSREFERRDAIEHIAAGKRQNMLMIACGAVVIVALAVTAFLLFRGRGAQLEIPAPAPAQHVVPSAPAAPAPAPVPAAELPPKAVPADSQAELEAARASLRVDVLEALMTGQWGELEAHVTTLTTTFSDLGQGMPEWIIYEEWIKEWKKAEFNAPPVQQLYAAMRAAALPAIAAAGGDVASLAEPAWKGDSAADADAYCSAIHSMKTVLAEDMDKYASQQARESEDYAQGIMHTVAWLAGTATEQDPKPSDALALVNTTVANLVQWNAHALGEKTPPTPSVFADAATGAENVEKRKDEYFDRLVDLIRSISAQKAGWDAIADPAAKARVYELGMQRVRIVNVRSRYKDDVRQWRTHEGQADVLKFFQMADEAFPNKH